VLYSFNAVHIRSDHITHDRAYFQYTSRSLSDSSPTLFHGAIMEGSCKHYRWENFSRRHPGKSHANITAGGFFRS